MQTAVSTGAAAPTEAFCAASQLAYLRAGAGGPTVVLLHGWNAFKELWWSTLVALAPHARLLAPDMPGHGGSPLAGDRRMADVAARVARFCAAQGLGRIALVGHSMGGNVALELALARPDLVGRLALVAPAAESAALPAYTRSYLQSARGWAALRLEGLLARQIGLVGRRVPHLHRGGFVLPALRRAAFTARHDAEALRHTLGGLFENPLGARPAAVQAATLVISGEFDPLVPPALSRRLAAQIPGARYLVIRAAGHNPMDDRPRAFHAAMLEFVRDAG